MYTDLPKSCIVTAKTNFSIWNSWKFLEHIRDLLNELSSNIRIGSLPVGNLSSTRSGLGTKPRYEAPNDQCNKQWLTFNSAPKLAVRQWSWRWEKNLCAQNTTRLISERDVTRKFTLMEIHYQFSMLSLEIRY